MLLAVKCVSPPCWAPTPPPAWTWLIFVAIAIFAGLIILADWKTTPPESRARARTAVFVWLASVVVIAVSAEAIELYTYSMAPR